MSNHVFSRAPQVNIPRSVFRRNHSIKTTIGTDYLYPIYVDEVLPGDTFEFRQELFGRLTTPLTPLMDDLYLDTFYFAIPVRLVDENFKRLMGESPVGKPDEDIVSPVLNSGTQGFDFNSLWDYLGIPPKVSNLDVLAWYPRAYNLVYNEWFRDTNLIEPVPVAGKLADSTRSESVDDYVLLKRAKRLDYFTGALPYPQRGPESSIGLTGSVPVYGDGNAMAFTSSSTPSANRRDILLGISGNNGYTIGGYRATGGDVAVANGTTLNPTSTVGNLALGLSMKGGADSHVYADLSEASAITVNNLREAVAIQHLYEIFARNGSGRYIDILRGAFGVVSPDARLQRPEYLGGSSERMNVTTVAQTSASQEDSPLGNLASFVTVSSGAYWKKSFTEHTIILGLANIRAKLSYSQGLNKMFSRRDRLDFYWPQLANLGEQPVLNKEIYAQGTSEDDDVFGYQERWAEYRYKPDTITGTFRPTHPQSLDVWHLSQEFESLPLLNQSFIEEAVPIKRVVAVPSEPPLMLWGDFQIKAARPMPLYSVPGLQRL